MKRIPSLSSVIPSILMRLFDGQSQWPLEFVQVLLVVNVMEPSCVLNAFWLSSLEFSRRQFR